jgi:hypothetical protein
LSLINVNPTMRREFNDNPNLARVAQTFAARDEHFAPKYGGAREDVQNARRIVGSGPGWIDRLEAAKAAGVALPALAGLGFAAPALLQEEQKRCCGRRPETGLGPASRMASRAFRRPAASSRRTRIAQPARGGLVFWRFGSGSRAHV